MKLALCFLLVLSVALFPACAADAPDRREGDQPATSARETYEKPKLAEIESETIRKVLENAREQTKTTTGYTQGYYNISYPNGDVPIETGACTDVLIRAFRNAGVDLQKEVHEDLARNFSAYPSKWGLSRPDTNIDHRRVPNLQTYFQRRGTALPITGDIKAYKPGDVVSWDLDGKGITHIGLVSNIWNERTNRYLIIHNIGGGAREEDRLFEWKVTGHYRYF